MNGIGIFEGKTEEQAREQILAQVREYCDEFHKKKTYEAGDRISYAGRVYDAEEMVNLVDSSLEFWLTSGRYTEQFERGLAKYLQVKYCSAVNSGSSANLLAFMALTSPLLKESDIYGAERVLFNLYFSPEEGEELRMQESKELSEFMLRFKKKVNVIWGYTHDSSLGKAVKITILATGFEVSDLTFKGEYGGDADEHIAQSQYIVLKPDQLDDNDLLEKLDKTPAYDRPKDFRDNFDGSEKKEESNGSGRRTIRF